MKRSGHWVWTRLTGPHTVRPLSQPIQPTSERYFLLITASIQTQMTPFQKFFPTFHSLIGARMISVASRVVSMRSQREIKINLCDYYFRRARQSKWSLSRSQNCISQNSLDWSVEFVKNSYFLPWGKPVGEASYKSKETTLISASGASSSPGADNLLSLTHIHIKHLHAPSYSHMIWPFSERIASDETFMRRTYQNIPVETPL